MLFMRKLTLSMAIFNRDVQLPEGNKEQHLPTEYPLNSCVIVLDLFGSLATGDVRLRGTPDAEIRWTGKLSLLSQEKQVKLCMLNTGVSHVFTGHISHLLIQSTGYKTFYRRYKMASDNTTRNTWRGINSAAVGGWTKTLAALAGVWRDEHPTTTILLGKLQ